jgi:hypothetical protein
MTLEPKGKPDVQPNQRPEITLARWSTRFWAWLADFIIVTTAAEVVFVPANAILYWRVRRLLRSQVR